MMEKLLHERLREFAEELVTFNVTGADNFKSDDYNLLMYMEEAEALAKEIERYYTPRPRDNKGIPFATGEIIYSIDPDTKYSAEIISVGISTLYICWEDGNYDWVDACDMQHEKPDSLEKLRDDMMKRNDIMYAPSPAFVLREFADRLSALIENGA